MHIISVNIETDLQSSRSVSISKIRKLEKQLSKTIGTLSINARLSFSIDDTPTQEGIIEEITKLSDNQVAQYKNILELLILRYSLRAKVAANNGNITDVGTLSQNSINNLLLAKEFYNNYLSIFKSYSVQNAFDVEVITKHVNTQRIVNSKQATTSYHHYNSIFSRDGLNVDLLKTITDTCKSYEQQIAAIEEKIVELNNKRKVQLTPSELQLCDNNGIIVPLA